MADTLTVDIGPVTLADAMAARDVLATAGPRCAPLAAMLALRIAQSERDAVLELRCELDACDRPAVVRNNARRTVMGRWT